MAPPDPDVALIAASLALAAERVTGDDVDAKRGRQENLRQMSLRLYKWLDDRQGDLPSTDELEGLLQAGHLSAEGWALSRWDAG